MHGLSYSNIIEGTPTKASTVLTTTTDKTITTKQGKITNEPEIEYLSLNTALCQMYEIFNRNVF